MALLLAEGFDGWGISDLGVMYPGSTAGNWTVHATNGRRGGSCLYRTNTADDTRLRWNCPSSSDKIYSGMAFRVDSISYGRDFKISYYGTGVGGTSVYWLFESTSMEIRFYNTYGAGDSLRGTKTGISLGTWYYVEMYALIDASGTLVGKVDGEEICNVSGIPTDGGGGGDYMTYMMIDFSDYNQSRLDDLYVCDGTGSYNNDFLGDCRVDPVYINGAGNYTQMAPSAGSNYQCVDETDLDTSDYVEGDADGEKDSYSFADVTTELDDDRIKGLVVVSPALRTIDNDNAKLRTLVRTGGSDYYDGLGESLSQSWRVQRAPFDRDPSDSGAWTQAKINACEFGVEAAITTTTSSTTTTT